MLRANMFFEHRNQNFLEIQMKFFQTFFQTKYFQMIDRLIVNIFLEKHFSVILIHHLLNVCINLSI